jgi:FAD/FMN-containing dehydrogenase
MADRCAEKRRKSMGPLEMKAQHERAVTLSRAVLDEFEERIRGEIITGLHPDYDDARLVWNGLIDRKPGLIVRCTGAADVMACVNLAREHGLTCSVRGGGHNVGGLAVNDGGLVIDLSGMRSVRVDSEGRRAWVQGGATLGDVDHETQAFGLSTALGVVSATGVAGLTLHGGVGWLTRKHGLALDNVLSFDIVTADGGMVRANADENSDLYWALRGGGGNFGVVTALEYRLHPIGPEVWQLMTLYPADEAKNLLRFFREEIPHTTEELGLIGIFWNAPDEEAIPAAHRGRPVFIFLGCYTGPQERGEAVLKPFREAAPVVADLSSTMPFENIQSSLDGEYPDGRRYYWKSLFLDVLNDEAIDAMIKHARTRPSPLTSIDVWALGGKMGKVEPTATPFARRDAPYLFAVESNWEDADTDEHNIRWTREVYRDMQRFSKGGVYLNFPGFGEEGEEMLKDSYQSNFERLKRVKAQYDPYNLFEGNLNIAPA